MNRTKATELLTDIISCSDRENKLQGKEFYKTALKILKDENTSENELRILYRSFCGYLAHGDFTDVEYAKINLLVDHLES